MCPRKHFVAARRLENRVEVLGQIDAPQDMAEYIGLCQLQTIEPLFRKYLPKGGQILEAGCGRGRWVLYLRGLGYDVAGIDLADSDLAAARAIDPSAPVERGDVLQAPFPDSSFDAVISLGVVEHFEGGPRQALAEVRRLLKPQGLFLVTVPTQNLVRYLVVDPIRTAVDLLRRLSGVRLAFGEYRYSRRVQPPLAGVAVHHYRDRAGRLPAAEEHGPVCRSAAAATARPPLGIERRRPSLQRLAFHALALAPLFRHTLGLPQMSVVNRTGLIIDASWAFR